MKIYNLYEEPAIKVIKIRFNFSHIANFEDLAPIWLHGAPDLAPRCSSVLATLAARRVRMVWDWSSKTKAHKEQCICLCKGLKYIGRFIPTVRNMVYALEDSECEEVLGSYLCHRLYKSFFPFFL